MITKSFPFDYLKNCVGTNSAQVCEDLITISTPLSKSTQECLLNKYAIFNIYSRGIVSAQVSNVISSTQFEVTNPVIQNGLLPYPNDDYSFTVYNDNLSGTVTGTGAPAQGTFYIHTDTFAYIGYPCKVWLESAHANIKVEIWDNTSGDYIPLSGKTVRLMVRYCTSTNTDGTTNIDGISNITLPRTQLPLERESIYEDAVHLSYYFIIVVFPSINYAKLRITYSISDISYTDCRGNPVYSGHEFSPITSTNRFGGAEAITVTFSNERP